MIFPKNIDDMKIISYESAFSIVQQFAKEISEIYGRKLLAVYAIGSLGADYYRPGQSDIDTALIFSISRDELFEVETVCGKIADKYYKEYDIPKGFGAVVFAEEQLFPPYRKEEELILEILRLKTQSKQVYGSYSLDKVPFPDKKAIIDDAKHFQEWADSEKERDPDFYIKDTVSLVNSTLIALKRYLMIEKDIVDFNKFHIISLYLENDPPIVCKDLFDFIESELKRKNSIETELNKDLFEHYIKEHDQIYETINRIVFADC